VNKRVRLLTEQQMTKLSTQRLLSYKNRLLKCHDTPNEDEFLFRVSKESNEWKETYRILRQILSTRENIE
jgi:hypothetical protein